MMKKLLLCAMMVLLLPSCMLLGQSPDGLKGLKVDKAAEVLRILADEIELYDLDKDGLISAEEAVPLGLSAANRLYMAMRDAQ